MKDFLKDQFGVIAPVTLLYAVLYAFCTFKNSAGVTFPFFIAGSFLYLCFCLSKAGLTLRRGSVFYMAAMMLLAVATFCTGDLRIIAMNKTGIFFLMMSMLFEQFYDTGRWNLPKYLRSMLEMIFRGLGRIERPFEDGAEYLKKKPDGGDRRVWYGLLGFLIAVPLVIGVMFLLSGADAVFRSVTDRFFAQLNVSNILNVILRIALIFFASYTFLSILLEKSIKEEVEDRKTGEPVFAIVITGMLTVMYLVFSVIQILFLFVGRMQLPAGYTYAAYAREGFFQLLAVSILNLIIVLIGLNRFKDSKVLKVILTVMSFCTFIMILSSFIRMIMYIRYYYLTFLRIFVLWALAVLFALFVGVVINILRANYRLYTHGVVVVTLLYLVLAFGHPDYWIAKVGVANSPEHKQTVEEGDFFLNEVPFTDYSILAGTCSDAAPVIIPYLEEIGGGDAADDEYSIFSYVSNSYMAGLREECKDYGLRSFNVARHMALKQAEKIGGIYPAPSEDVQ